MPGATEPGKLPAMHRFVEHTGEVELEIQAPTEAGVFAEAVAAFGELLEGGNGERARHEIAVSAGDRAALLVDWMNELVFLAEVEGFVPERLSSLELRNGGLAATVDGRRGNPPHLVKAVTLNDLKLERTDGCWQARVVLDV
jgi:SHS2 domain-containing protein